MCVTKFYGCVTVFYARNALRYCLCWGYPTWRRDQDTTSNLKYGVDEQTN